MFAVVMGVAAFAPAFAANGSNGQKTTLCHFEAAHFDEELQEAVPDTWSVITINDRALPAHMGEGDDGHVDTEVTTQAEIDACLAQNEA